MPPRKITPKEFDRLKQGKVSDRTVFIVRIVRCPRRRCTEWAALSERGERPKCPKHQVTMYWLGNVYQDIVTKEVFRHR